MPFLLTDLYSRSAEKLVLQETIQCFNNTIVQKQNYFKLLF
jgi:hypothetical protein